jgi:hypothetical protein
MEATTTVTIRCRLESGETVNLSAADCAAILNAMARRRMLTVSVENIPDDLAHLYSEELCAWADDDEDYEQDDGDQLVVLSVDASNHTCGILRDKPKGKKKR